MSPPLSSLLEEDTSSSVWALSEDTLSVGKGSGALNPVWSEGQVEEMWMGRAMEDLWEASESGMGEEVSLDPGPSGEREEEVEGGS